MSVPACISPMFCLDQDLIVIVIEGLVANIAYTVIGRGALGIIALMRFPAEGNIRRRDRFPEYAVGRCGHPAVRGTVRFIMYHINVFVSVRIMAIPAELAAPCGSYIIAVRVFCPPPAVQ